MGKQLAADSTEAFGETGTKLIGRPPDHKPTLIAPRKRAYSVKETAKELAVSVPQVYVILGRRDLHGKKVGSRTVILGAEIDRYLASLPDAVINEQQPLRRAEEARAAEARTAVPAPETSGSRRTADKRTGKAGRRRVEASAGA